MIYGKLTLEDWRTACVKGDEPESSFESYNLRLFFYGTLYNRDVLLKNRLSVGNIPEIAYIYEKIE